MKPYDTQLNREMNTGDKIEETIVRALAFLFIVFFAEGIFLAIAVGLSIHDSDTEINLQCISLVSCMTYFLAFLKHDLNFGIAWNLINLNRQDEDRCRCHQRFRRLCGRSGYLQPASVRSKSAKAFAVVLCDLI